MTTVQSAQITGPHHTPPYVRLDALNIEVVMDQSRLLAIFRVGLHIKAKL